MESRNTNNQVQGKTAAFDLIKGEFSAEEAQEILMHMLHKKISFHEMKIFSKDIRFGETDEVSIKRIEELRKTKNECKAFLKEAIESGRKLRVKTYTEIEII